MCNFHAFTQDKERVNIFSFVDSLCFKLSLHFEVFYMVTSLHAPNQLRGFEYIKGIVLDPIPFDIERDLVTATMKKRRNNMLKYYQVRKAFKDSDLLHPLICWPFLLILSSSNPVSLKCSLRSMQYTKSWMHRRMPPKLSEETDLIMS